MLRLVQAANEPDCVQLGAAVPAPEFLPARAIQRALSAAARAGGDRLATYQFPPGSPKLRRQMARRMLEAGCRVGPDEIVITSGCQEALILALRAVAKKGDVVAIESPSFYGLLQAIESLEMRALEIPTDPATGISIDALELALDKWPVKAYVLTANFSNPMGSVMPLDKKQALEQCISIAPGQIFSASGKYRNCIRLNCAQPWNDALDRALMTVGRMAEAGV